MNSRVRLIHPEQHLRGRRALDALGLYNRTDLRDVWRIVRRLRKRGISIEIDRTLMEPGDLWITVVREHLRQCSSVLVFPGPAGFGSFQEHELGLALQEALE